MRQKKNVKRPLLKRVQDGQSPRPMPIPKQKYDKQSPSDEKPKK